MQSDVGYYADEEPGTPDTEGTSSLNPSPTKSDFGSVDTDVSQIDIYEPLSRYNRSQFEALDRYSPGGFHPIDIGDRLGEKGRFHIVHKLGFGSSSTVWLCLEAGTQCYKAVKVIAANESALRCHENAAIRSLVHSTEEQDVGSSLVVPEEDFWIDGPNGHHLCLVMPVLGPNLLDGLEGAGLDTPEYLTDLCFRLSHIVGYLHKNGMIHGDIRPQKIMMVLDEIWMRKLSRKELLEKYLQRPSLEKAKLLRKNFSTNGPRYLVRRATLTSLERRFRTGHVALTDFSRACQSSALLSLITLHRSCYSAPEARVTDVTHGFASDIWSLAACLFLIRTGRELISEMKSDAAFISWLAWTFGPIPGASNIEIKTFLSQDNTVSVDWVDGGEIDIVGYLENSEKPASRHRRAHSTRTLRKAGKTPPICPRCQNRVWMDWETESEDDEGQAHQWAKPRTRSGGCAEEHRTEVYLPADSGEWELAMRDWQDKTGFPSLLQESLGRKETWYEIPEANRVLKRQSNTTTLSEDETTSPTSTPRSDDYDAGQECPSPLGGHGSASSGMRTQETAAKTGIASETSSSEPRYSFRTRIHGVTHGSIAKRSRNWSRPRIVVDPRDEESCTRKNDGMIEYVYSMRRGEVEVLSDLLEKMLQTSARSRIGIKEVLRHPWFGDRNKRTRMS